MSQMGGASEGGAQRFVKVSPVMKRFFVSAIKKKRPKYTLRLRRQAPVDHRRNISVEKTKETDAEVSLILDLLSISAGPTATFLELWESTGLREAPQEWISFVKDVHSEHSS